MKDVFWTLLLCLVTQALRASVQEPYYLYDEADSVVTYGYDADTAFIEETATAWNWIEPEMQEKPALRRLDQEEWREATEKLVYDEKMAPQVPEAERKPENSGSWGMYLSYTILIVLFLALLYLLYRRLAPQARSVKVGAKEINPESAEDLTEMDLVSLLRRAEQVGDYREIIRLHFLLVVKELAGKQFIRWRPEKTNRDYSRELFGQQTLHKEFMELANLFEYTRYGNAWVDADDVQRLVPKFLQFSKLLAQLREPGNK